MDAWTDEAADGDPHERIARLEAQIEELSDTAERCRKIALVSKAALAIGAAWMALIMLGAVTPYGKSLLGALTLTIGGLVAFGSNASTARQATAAIAAAEQERAALIGRIELQLVPERGRIER